MSSAAGAFDVRAWRNEQIAKLTRGRESGPARTWREMDMPTRTLLVMLASTQAGDPRAIAGQCWEQFSQADQAAIGARARHLRKQLQGAENLR